jgi:hypothetical protein
MGEQVGNSFDVERDRLEGTLKYRIGTRERIQYNSKQMGDITFIYPMLGKLGKLEEGKPRSKPVNYCLPP